MRLKLHDLPFHLQEQVSKQLHSLAPELRHTKPEHNAGEEQVVVNEDEEGGAGRITVRITRHGVRLLDADNLAGGVKYLVDALRYQGLIPNDDPTTIRLVVNQRKTKKAQVGTKILISYDINFVASRKWSYRRIQPNDTMIPITTNNYQETSILVSYSKPIEFNGIRNNSIR